MDVLIDKVTYMRLHLVRLAGGDPRVVVIFRAASKLRAVICREEELNQRYFDLVTAPGRVYRDRWVGFRVVSFSLFTDAPRE